MIRSSNSGISAIIDGYGRIQAGLDFGTVGVVDGTMPPRTAPIWHILLPSLNFGLLESLLILLVFFSRMSFIFRRN